MNEIILAIGLLYSIGVFVLVGDWLLKESTPLELRRGK